MGPPLVTLLMSRATKDTFPLTPKLAVLRTPSIVSDLRALLLYNVNKVNKNTSNVILICKKIIISYPFESNRMQFIPWLL